MNLKAEIAALKTLAPVSNDALTIEKLKLEKQNAELSY